MEAANVFVLAVLAGAFTASMTRREAGVTQKQPEPFVELHSEDGGSLGITDGDLVRLVSRSGTLEAEARVADGVLPGVWMALPFAQAKANSLTIEAVDPRTGTPEYKACSVRLEKA